MDKRLLPANDRAALQSLRGLVNAPRYTEGHLAQVNMPIVDLCRDAGGPRERQLVLGDAVTVVDRDEGWAFVRAEKDGYCGYLPERALGAPGGVTHWVAAPSTHLYPEPRVQAHEISALPFGARLTVTGQTERFAETPDGFVPASHLRRIEDRFDDPVDVARLFLGTPYLWGGNTRAGLDCSGLVQVSMLACGVGCPGDSDLQESLGIAVPDGSNLQRGDLLFWKGHVAMVCDDSHIIHASGHVMAVIVERIDAAIERIALTGNPVIARRRI